MSAAGRSTGGITPTSVIGWPAKVRALPTIRGSAPNRRRQRALLITMTRGAAGAQSSAVEGAALSAFTPRTAKVLHVTRKPSTSIGSARPVKAPEAEPSRASPSNERASSRQRK